MYTWNTEINILTVIIILWSLAWKCYSTWIAAGRREKKWFVALVVFNTVGILDMIYVFGIAKKKWSDVTNSGKKLFSKKTTNVESTPVAE